MSLYPLPKYVTVSNTWAIKDTMTSYFTKYTLQRPAAAAAASRTAPIATGTKPSPAFPGLPQPSGSTQGSPALQYQQDGVMMEMMMLTMGMMILTMRTMMLTMGMMMLAMVKIGIVHTKESWGGTTEKRNPPWIMKS